MRLAADRRAEYERAEAKSAALAEALRCRGPHVLEAAGAFLYGWRRRSARRSARVRRSPATERADRAVDAVVALREDHEPLRQLPHPS